MKIIIWFPFIKEGENGACIYDASYMEKSLNILIAQENAEIEAVSLDRYVESVLFGKKLQYINERSLKDFSNISILTIGGKQIGMNAIRNKATALGIDTNYILCDWIVCLPGFSMDKYNALRSSDISIISSNCFGGMISHLLGFKFNSPFVNLFLTERDFINFLKDPLTYVDEKLIYTGKEIDRTGEFEFPVCKLGDIDIHMNHYKTFAEATQKWYDRIRRINWFNLCVEMFTDDPNILEEFDKLPYGKKICFTSFKSKKHSAYYINPELFPLMEKKFPLSDLVTYHAINPYQYDIFDMLLYGKKTEIRFE